MAGRILCLRLANRIVLENIKQVFESLTCSRFIGDEIMKHEFFYVTVILDVDMLEVSLLQFVAKNTLSVNNRS